MKENALTMPRSPRSSLPEMSGNERAILDHLLKARMPMNRADLARATGLALQSVSRIVESMSAKGLLHSSAPIKRAGPGAQGPVIELCGDSAFALGLSITTDSLSVIVIDLKGEPRAILRENLSDLSREAILATARRLVDAAIVNSGAAREKIVGIGLAMTGFFVDARSVNPPLALAELALIDLRALFESELGFPILLENDATAAAAAEALLGVGQESQTFAYLHFAAGVGAGLILNGRPMRGHYGNAGEISSVLPPAMLPDRPTLELLRDMLADDGLPFHSITAMLAAFDPHWPTVDKWVTRVLPALDTMISALAAVFDPEIIVLGGRMPSVLAVRLINRTSSFLTPRYGVTPPQPRVVPARIVEDPPLFGAATLLLRQHFYPCQHPELRTIFGPLGKSTRRKMP